MKVGHKYHSAPLQVIVPLPPFEPHMYIESLLTAIVTYLRFSGVEAWYQYTTPWPMGDFLPTFSG